MGITGLLKHHKYKRHLTVLSFQNFLRGMAPDPLDLACSNTMYTYVCTPSLGSLICSYILLYNWLYQLIRAYCYGPVTVWTTPAI